MATYEMGIGDNDIGILTVVDGAELFVVTSEEPNFLLCLDAARSGKSLAEIRKLSVPDVSPITSLSERVQVSDDKILFDGEEVHDELAKTIRRYWAEGRPYSGLVKFMERLSLNSCEHSREALWKWISSPNVQMEINNQGLLIAYKGVRTDKTSVHAGPAIVDDVPVNGHVPNHDGSIVRMDRSAVQHDPSVACGTGLHVGSLSYARGFGQIVLVCLVDPVDVVSVPSDCQSQKMRVCQYEVIEPYNDGSYEPNATSDEKFDAVQENIESSIEDSDTRNRIKHLINKIRGN